MAGEIGDARLAIIMDARTGARPSFFQYVRRYVAYAVSIVPLFLGIIWVGFDKRKQGWHDKIANTVVIRKEHSADWD